MKCAFWCAWSLDRLQPARRLGGIAGPRKDLATRVACSGRHPLGTTERTSSVVPVRRAAIPSWRLNEDDGQLQGPKAIAVSDESVNHWRKFGDHLVSDLMPAEGFECADCCADGVLGGHIEQ